MAEAKAVVPSKEENRFTLFLLLFVVSAGYYFGPTKVWDIDVMCRRGRTICVVDREKILVADTGQRGLMRVLSAMDYLPIQVKTPDDLKRHLSLRRHIALLAGPEVVPLQSLPTLLKTVRENDSGIGILVRLNGSNARLETKLFELGVDDVVIGSTSASALAKRIQVRIHGKLLKGVAVQNVRFGETLVDLRNLTVWNHGKVRRISKGLLTLLRYFLENKGRVITRQEIIETLWADSVLDPEGKNIDMQVSKLRRFIEADSKKPAFLRTVRGVGYEMPL